MVRVEMRDYEAWLAAHKETAPDRRSYGMEDGPIYRDIDTPNAALVHIRAVDLKRAMEWPQSERFRSAAERATLTRSNVYVAEPWTPSVSSS